jgi:hypothetical protein
MEAIENAAFISIGQACGFAGLAVFCMVFGLMFDPVLAARAGGLTSFSVAATLNLCAFRSHPSLQTNQGLVDPTQGGSPTGEHRTKDHR